MSGIVLRVQSISGRSLDRDTPNTEVEFRAVQLLELANEEVYDINDMPERWQGVFEGMEENLYSSCCEPVKNQEEMNKNCPPEPD